MDLSAIPPPPPTNTPAVSFPPPSGPPVPQRQPDGIPVQPGRGYFGGLKLSSGLRLVSALIDYLPPALVIAYAPWPFGVMAIGFIFANSAFLQGLTGWSLGKKLLGLQLGYPVRWHGEPGMVLAYPGIPRATARLLINLFFASSFILLVPMIFGIIFGKYHRSWGDCFMQTIVVTPGSRLELEDKVRGQVSAMNHPAPILPN